MMYTKHVLEQDGMKLSLTALLLFPYVKIDSGLGNIPHLNFKVELYDGTDNVGTRSVTASSLRNGYNCVKIDFPDGVPVTHIYHTLLSSHGVKELAHVVSVGTYGAQT